MHYHVSRNGQTYGPYTLEDLQRYVASGNVLPTDLAKTDEMTDWVAVSEILAGSAVPVTAFSTPGYANPTYVDPAYNPGAALAASPYPDAPNLHWGLVLLFAVLTCSLFTVIWDLVISLWLKKIKPDSKAYVWNIVVLVLLVVRMFLGMAMVGSALRGSMMNPNHITVGAGFYGIAALLWLLGLAMVVCYIVGAFVKRADLLEHFNTVESIGLQLSGVMTFFFAPFYFQYHLNKINAMKQAARFGAPRPY